MIWRSTRGEDFCVIKDPQIAKSFELNKAIPRLESMDEPARCNMDPAFPKEVRLSDNLYGATMPVISLRLKQMLESSGTNRVEYLPVELVNHKGRKEPNGYFVVHPLDVLDCINLEASGVEWNNITPDRISRCKGLVLKQDAIPGDFTIFRPKFWGKIILIRQDLVDMLQKADFTGLFFRPVDGYTGIG
jgi:hypothetical protein